MKWHAKCWKSEGNNAKHLTVSPEIRAMFQKSIDWFRIVWKKSIQNGLHYRTAESPINVWYLIPWEHAKLIIIPLLASKQNRLSFSPFSWHCAPPNTSQIVSPLSYCIYEALPSSRASVVPPVYVSLHPIFLSSSTCHFLLILAPFIWAQWHLKWSKWGLKNYNIQQKIARFFPLTSIRSLKFLRLHLKQNFPLPVEEWRYVAEIDLRMGVVERTSGLLYRNGSSLLHSFIHFFDSFLLHKYIAVRVENSVILKHVIKTNVSTHAV